MTRDRHVLGYARIPGPFGAPTPFGTVRGLLPAVFAELPRPLGLRDPGPDGPPEADEPRIETFEPMPMNWTEAFQMQDHAGGPIVFDPPKHS